MPSLRAALLASAATAISMVAATPAALASGLAFTTATTANGLGHGVVSGVHASGSAIYAATASGVSISTDNGSSWSAATTANGLGRDDVRSVYADARAIYAGTGGGGLSIAQLPAPAPVPGPLPVLGTAAAFGIARRLRRRLRATDDPLQSPLRLRAPQPVAGPDAGSLGAAAGRDPAAPGSGRNQCDRPAQSPGQRQSRPARPCGPDPSPIRSSRSAMPSPSRPPA